MLLLVNLKYFIIASVMLYMVFDYFEGRRLRDEREEMINLKTHELLQKINMWTITVIAIYLVFEPLALAVIPVTAMVVILLYGEMIGKFYFRKKM